MACSKVEYLYCTGPECDTFEPINPKCKETRCSWFTKDQTENTIKDAPKCHATPMQFEMADDWPNDQVYFWECRHCGRIIKI